MTLSDLPHLTIADVGPDRCTVEYDPSPWVGEGWIVGIFLVGHRFIWGRFHDLDKTERTCSFHPDQPVELSELETGSRHAFINGYWGVRAELVLNRASRWNRRHFEPTDTVRYPAGGGGWMATRSTGAAPAGGEILSGVWDHEHCDICQMKIGRGGEATGYFSPPGAWVCEECYTSFVAPGSLAFITM